MLVPYIVVAVFGLAFGSFLNVCIYRLPRHESVVKPRSHCPSCNHPIRWYDNVPLFSFLMLRGRCRDCHSAISPVYPLVEGLAALVLVACFHQYGLSPEFVKFGLLSLLLLIVIFSDLRERRIPHSVTVFGMVFGLLFSFLTPVDNRPLEWILRRLGFFVEGAFSSLLGSVGGALAGGGLFYIIGEAFYRLGGKQKEYLGFGDVMLMLAVGTFLGIPLTLMTILLGSLGGTIVALALSVNPRYRGYAWPYGTFLGIAALYAALDGPRLLEAYLRWAGLA